jgi:hypothetical protein
VPPSRRRGELTVNGARLDHHNAQVLGMTCPVLEQLWDAPSDLCRVTMMEDDTTGEQR